MIKNHLREYDKMSTYWHVDTIDKFENLEVHGIVGDIKYLCCISCQSEILGYWLISVSAKRANSGRSRTRSTSRVLECSWRCDLY